jgi:N-acetylglucosamine-6-phosphate deacetylase
MSLIREFIKSLPSGTDCEVKAILNGNKDYLLYNGTIIGIDDKIDITDIPQDASVEVIDASFCKITTGLFDTHIHGGFGCCFNDFTEESLMNLLIQLPKHGITSILATVMTASEYEIKSAIAKLKRITESAPKGICKIEGIHLEGPFLAKKFAGVHPPEHLKMPSLELYKNLEDDFIKVVTLAPELDKHRHLIKYLKSKGVIVSAGHSEASPEAMADIYQVTHLFNAMLPINHRTPSLTSDALFRDDVTVEVIADGIHIDPETLKLIFKIKKPERVMLISDALPIAGSKETKGRFADQDIIIRNGKALNGNGTITGSIKFLDEIGEKLVKDKLMPFDTFIQYASTNPIKNYNLPYELALGKKADLVLWRADKPYMAIIDGVVA